MFVGNVILGLCFSFSFKVGDLGAIWMAFFITQFSSLNFHHLSLITHHFKILYLFGIITHHSIFFNCLYDPHTDPMSVDFSLSFFFPLPLPFIFPCFSLLFSSTMLTHILIKPTMILIFMLFPDLQYNQKKTQCFPSSFSPNPMLFMLFQKPKKKKKKKTKPINQTQKPT